jgi:hypothetical protein
VKKVVKFAGQKGGGIKKDVQRLKNLNKKNKGAVDLG